jgi:hypothetical protein
MVQLVDGNFSVERAYSPHNGNMPAFDRMAPVPHTRLNRLASVVAILLSSLGLWAAIWAVLASIVSFGLG